MGLLSLAVALGGCSAIKLGYSNLPELAHWWVDGYVDLDDEQDPKVKDDLHALHAWHRQQELPRIVGLLAEMERLAPGALTPQQACAFEPRLRERLAAVRERAEPALAQRAVGLAPAQLQHLQRKFARNAREFEREWVRLPAAERLDKRVEAYAGRAESLYGRLDDAQRAVLRQQLATSVFDPERTLAERRRRQQDVLAVLGGVAGATPAAARPALRGLLDRMLVSPDPAYRAYTDALRQETCRLVAALHNAMQAPQREFAARRLRAWQRDLSELSAAP